MRKGLLLAVALIVLSATGAGAANPAWVWAYRGTGDPIGVPVMTGTEPCQTGQENVAWYRGVITDLGDGDAKNWWKLETDPTYGVVTRLHGNAGTKLNWTCYGNDDLAKLPAQCANQFVYLGGARQWPAGSVWSDGACHAIRFKLEKFDLADKSTRICWSAQAACMEDGGPLVPGTVANPRFGYKTQLGLRWEDASDAVYVMDRDKYVCKAATQSTKGGALSDNGWIDVWVNVTPCDVFTTSGTIGYVRSNKHDAFWSNDGGATWNDPITANPIVACREDAPNARIDMYAGNGAGKMIEYLMDYNCVGNKAVPAGTIAIPAKPASVTDQAIGVVKSSPLGTPATFNGVITNVFTGKVPWDLTGTSITVYYLEQPDGVANPLGRENGVKVWISNRQAPTDPGDPNWVPAVGDYVQVVGTLGKWHCEKMLFACSMQKQQTPTVTKAVEPLGMNNTAVASSYKSTMFTFIPEQLPADGKPGANAHGLYARVWGKVTLVGGNFFYVDDGTGFVDGVGDEDNAGDPIKGIRVVDPSGSVALPNQGDYVKVAGSLGNNRVQFIDAVPQVIDRVIPVIWMTGWQSGQ